MRRNCPTFWEKKAPMSSVGYRIIHISVGILSSLSPVCDPSKGHNFLSLSLWPYKIRKYHIVPKAVMRIELEVLNTVLCKQLRLIKQ